MTEREARLQSFLVGDLEDAIEALDLVVTSTFLLGNERQKIVEIQDTLKLISSSFIRQGNTT
jgi:hypothetical protein